MNRRLPKFEYLEPKTIEQAIAYLEEKEKTRVIAGGTDLIPRLKKRLIPVACLINLKGIPELDSVRFDEREGLKIGALTKLSTLTVSEKISHRFTALAEAAARVGSIPIQNIGTIGGNICQEPRCWYFNQSHAWHQSWEPCFRKGGKICFVNKKGKSCQAVLLSDVSPSLLVLDAKLRATSKNGERTIAANKFFRGIGTHVLGSAEVLTEIQIPPVPIENKSIYVKYSPRRVIDFPIVGIAISLRRTAGNGRCSDAKIAIGALACAPFRAERAEALLVDQKIDEELIQQAAEAVRDECKNRAVTHLDFSKEYKLEITKVLVARGLQKITGFGAVA
jgi:4-hydroxybenzoyl-CoA reductase subunit beta